MTNDKKIDNKPNALSAEDLTLRKTKRVFLFLFILWIAVLEIQNFTGYCRKEGRYFSEEELVDRVLSKEFLVKRDNSHYFHSIKNCVKEYNEDLGEKFVAQCQDYRIYYLSLQNFKDHNPNSYQISHSSWYVGNFFADFIGKIFNKYSLFGLSVYTVRNIEGDSKYEEDHYSVNSCGKAYKFAGMRLNRDEYLTRTRNR